MYMHSTSVSFERPSSLSTAFRMQQEGRIYELIQYDVSVHAVGRKVWTMVIVLLA